MNRNIIPEIEQISEMLAREKNAEGIKNFMIEMLTASELETLSKRWRILELLYAGAAQRRIAAELKVSLCNITRGAKILKNKSSIAAKYLAEEKNNEQK